MASGLLKCRKCGKNLQVRPNQDPDPSYYICKTRRLEGIAVCSCPNLPDRDFEPLLLKAVTEDILSPSNMKTNIEAISRELEVPHEEQVARLDLIDEELKKLAKRQDRVMTAYESGAYTVEDYSNRMAPLRKSEAELREKRAEAARELDREAVIVANPHLVIEFAQDVSNLIRHSQPKEMRELLKRFIECVWIEPKTATIIYRIPLPNDGPNPGSKKRELALDGEPVSVRAYCPSVPLGRGLRRLPGAAGAGERDRPWGGPGAGSLRLPG